MATIEAVVRPIPPKKAAQETLQNWNKTVASTPARVVRVDSVEALQAVVRDADGHPSPLLAVGSLRECWG
jgi:hypothetical protein